MLLIAPETDGQVPPERSVELYEDAGAQRKSLVHLACWASSGEVRLTRD